MCKRFVLDRFCKFVDDCDYLHLNKNYSKEAYNELIEDMKNIKAEVDYLKNKINSLSYIKEEAKVVQKAIRIGKEEICQIKAENIETAKKISMLEEDMETDT